MKTAAILSIICALAGLPATARAAAACGTPVAPESLTPHDYRPIFRACRDDAGAERLAIRRFASGGDELMLAVDPQTLATSIERAACMSCEETSDTEQQDTRLLRAVAAAGKAPAQGLTTNAGLVHGKGAGAFLTGDLCPSHKPLDRDFIEKVAALGPHTPVTLAISGAWLTHHREDFAWLKAKAQSGALDISWANHSHRHPYVPGRADAQNYLLTPGTDVAAEALDTERLLIENGVVPSVFFRFPGLVGDAATLATIRELHLVSLGADSWLVLGPPPRPGSIVLVHPNGNEPAGLRLFDKLLARGALPRPLRRLEEAP